MNKYRYRFWAPLVNYESESSEIRLADDITIKRASDSEKQDIKELLKNWPTISYGDFLLECMITKETPESEPTEYIKKEGRPKIEKVLTILRLYKENVVGYNLIVQSLAEREPHGLSAITLRHYQLWRDPTQRLAEQKYQISKREENELKKFFAELNIEDFERFDLAIEYFNKSYIEPYTPRDSFLDLMISLENLYLKGEILELGYKLRMRMAYVLAKELGKRKRIAKDIKNAYKYRGRIVHGEQANTPDLNYEFLLKIRGYTRESLKIFIKNPALRNNLDESILKGN